MRSNIVMLSLLVILAVAQLAALTLVVKAAEDDTYLVICEFSEKRRAVPTYNVSRVIDPFPNVDPEPPSCRPVCVLGGPCSPARCADCLREFQSLGNVIETSDRVRHNKVIYVLHNPGT